MIRYIYIKKLFTSVIVLLASMFLHNISTAITLGVVADNGLNKNVTVFNADNDTILGSVVIPGGPLVGGVAMTVDQKLAFVTNGSFLGQVYVIDLSNSSLPVLATGINPISTFGTIGQGLAISPDNKFLVVSDGGNVQPIKVIDIASRTVVSTLLALPSTESVNFAEDGSLLTTSAGTLPGSGLVRRYTISPSGVLTDTGFALLGQNDPYQALGTMNAGVVINFGSSDIQSFTLPTMTPVDNRPLSSINGIVGVFSPDNTRFYARASASVDVFGFNPLTGSLSLTPSLTIATGPLLPLFGIRQIAIHPNGAKLYVPVSPILGSGRIDVYDALTGAPLPSITGPSISRPNGMAIRIAAPPTLSKSFSPTFINLNNQATLTIDFGNTNGSPLILSSDFSDTLPSGLSIVGTPSTTCTGDPGFFTFTANSLTLLSSANASIPPGGCTITATVKASAPGAFVNTTSTLSITGVPLIIGPATATLPVLLPCCNNCPFINH